MKKSKHNKRIWPQFKGYLTLKQITEGAAVAQKNAIALLEDAKLLFAARRFSSASFMAIIAIEEYGKLSILSLMAITPHNDLKERWRAYRTHTGKNSSWVLPELVDSEPRTIEDLAAITSSDALHPQMLDELKQLCLYTDCLDGVKWSSPDDIPSVAPEELATYLLNAAQRVISDTPFSEELLELEAKHLSRVAGTSVAEIKLAFEAFSSEAREKGVLPLTESFVKKALYERIDFSGA